MKCENCYQIQKTLHAEMVTSQLVCDYCYSHTLNPYLRDVKVIEKEQSRKELKEVLS